MDNQFTKNRKNIFFQTAVSLDLQLAFAASQLPFFLNIFLVLARTYGTYSI